MCVEDGVSLEHPIFLGSAWNIRNWGSQPTMPRVTKKIRRIIYE